jgi:hypothetical protein
MGGVTVNPIAIPVYAPRPAAETPVAAPQAETPPPIPVAAPAPPTEEAKPIVVRHGEVEATFSYDRDLHRVIITLTREDTGEIVLQIPPEQARGLINGLLRQMGDAVDQRG